MQHTVLVVDDQWSLQELVRIVLTAAGFRVTLAHDGTTGLSLAIAERPDLVLVNLQLPNREAVELLRGLREESLTADIPAVLLTTDTAGELFSAALRAGVATYLQRPVHASTLLQKLDRVLERQHMRLAV